MKVLEPKGISSGGSVREEVLMFSGLEIGWDLGLVLFIHPGPVSFYVTRPLKVLAILASDRPSSHHFYSIVNERG